MIYDDFGGASVEAAKWDVSTPFGDSSVSQAGGVLSLQNRGTIVSTTSVSSSYTAEGSFRFTGSEFDRFGFTTRSTGQVGDNPFEFVDGLRFGFRLHRNDGSGWASAVFIHEHASNPWLAIELGSADVAFVKNQWIDFKVVDDGFNVDFFVLDMVTPILSVNSSAGSGNLIGAVNREGSGGGSSISSGSAVDLDFINVVPEPSASLLLLAGVVVGLGRRKRAC